jgi:hypothetical protein
VQALRPIANSIGSLSAGLALGSLLSLGCGAPLRLYAEQDQLFTPGAARITVRSTLANQLQVQVWNQTGYPLTIYRDNFLLSTPLGTRSRLAGGASNVYVINPGGRHDVKLRYDLSGLARGDSLALLFQTGLLVNGQSLPIGPLPLRVR